MNKLKQNKGFTLVELLLYITLFAIIAGVLTGVLIISNTAQNKEVADAEVAGQLDFILSTTQRLVRDASLVELVYEGTTTSTSCSTSSTYCSMSLRMKDTSLDPTVIRSDATAVYIKQGVNAEEKLTSDKVSIDYLRFTKFEITGGHANVELDASLSFITSNPKFAVTKTIKSSVSRVSAAIFDSDLIPTTTNMFNIGQTLNQWKDALFGGNLTIGGSLEVGGGTAPNSSILTLNSTTKGFLIPRMTTAQKVAITSPVTGLSVYDMDTKRHEFYNGSSWNPLGGEDSDWTINQNEIYSSATKYTGIGTGSSPVTTLHVQNGTGFGSGLYSVNPSQAELVTLFEDYDKPAVLQIASEDESSWMSHIILTGVDTVNSVNKNWAISAWGPNDANAFSIGYKKTTSQPWAYDNSLKVGLSILTNGNVGVSKQFPETELHIDSGNQGTVKLDGNTGGCFQIEDSDNAGWTYCSFNDGGYTCGIDLNICS